MKKTIIFSIFAVAVSFISSVNTTFAADCDINEVSFSPINTTNSIEGQQTTLTVKFTGCAEGIQIIPKSARRLSSTQFRTESQDELVEVKNNPSNLYIPGNKTTITVKYKLYEDGCYGNVLGSDCNYYVNIKHLGNTVWNAREILSSIPANQESTKNFQNGIMFASCGEGLNVCDPANNSWEFVSSNVQIKADNECNLTQNDIQFINQPFTEIGGQTIALKIKTKNKCTGIPIQVHLMSKITNQGGVETIDIDPEIEGEDYIQLIANEGKDVVINFVGHDEECSGGRNPDCHIYVDVKTNNGNLIASTKSLLPSTTLMGESELQQFRVNSNFQKGVFVADCDGVCGGDDWEYKTISGGYTNSPSQENGNIGLVLPQGTYDTSSPCYNAELNGGNGGYTDGCYELLAPIPGITAQYTDGDGNVRDSGFIEEDGRQYVDTNKIQLGDYINQIFRIALGILMVIAVIMIIIAGVEYMTVESMFGKSAAKSRITNALTGLIIGLGIFLILSTINPKLLEVNFGKDLKVLTIEMKNDVQQREFIETTNTSGILAPPLPEILEYEPLIGYLYHQQGPYGGPSTLWAAKNGYATVPSKTPFLLNAGGVQSNINAQFGTQMSPKDFVEKFYKILKAKEAKINTIPATNATAVENAASDVGVSSSVLKTICMIESYNCTQAGVVNKYGYTGLFQFHPKSSWPAWRKNSSSVITKPYDNAYAGARFLKYNLQKYQKDKNKM